MLGVSEHPGKGQPDKPQGEMIVSKRVNSLRTENSPVSLKPSRINKFLFVMLLFLNPEKGYCMGICETEGCCERREKKGEIDLSLAERLFNFCGGKVCVSPLLQHPPWSADTVASQPGHGVVGKK